MAGIIGAGAGRRAGPSCAGDLAIFRFVGEALTIRAPGAATQTYEEYYGLTQSPFSLAPDPHFLYLSESHEEAIRQLLDAARRNEGVIVLTGDVGTGKTTIARALLTRLDKTSFASLVLNPFLSVDELLREVLLDFGVISRDDIRSGRAVSASRHDLTSTLHDFLLSLHPIGGARRAHHRRGAAPAAGGARADSRDLDRRDQHDAPAAGGADRPAGAARRAGAGRAAPARLARLGARDAAAARSRRRRGLRRAPAVGRRQRRQRALRQRRHRRRHRAHRRRARA